MESDCVDFLVFCTDCFYPVALLLELQDKVKNFIRYTCLYQPSRIYNVKISKSLNNKLSLELLLSISLINFVFAFYSTAKAGSNVASLCNMKVSSKSILQRTRYSKKVS